MIPDGELLRQYAEHRDDAAFAELVRRHLDLVYSVALRQANGDVPLAQDATQTVFVDLARKAHVLTARTTLAGWLHTSARYAAVNHIRGDSRRRAREQEAITMQNINSAPETNWAEIGPLLDEAVGQLRETDREAVLLRFYKNLSHQEVGAALGLGEEAARKRVDRALEKLREHFGRRGVTASSVLLATAIAENSVQAAPVGLVASVTSASLAGGNVIAGGAILTALFMTTKTKIILAVVVILAIVAMQAIKWQSSSEPSVSAIATALRSPKISSPLFASLPKAPPPQVAAPVVAPVPAGASSGSAMAEVISGGTLTLSSAPANADLKTAIPSLAHYLELKDFVHVIPFVMTPAEVQEALDSRQVASIEDLADLVQTKINDNTNGNIGAVVSALKIIQDKDPTMDETGTTAVYQLNPESPDDKITFLKKDGLWYLY